MDNKDWSGNSVSVYSIHGASNHSEQERNEHDYYATPPEAVRMLIDREKFEHKILEPCCGGGHIVTALLEKGFEVTTNDLYDYGFECDTHNDFLMEINEFDGDIITNPPYKMATEFVEHALNIIPEGRKVAMFLKLTFLEGKKRRHLFDTMQLQKVYVSRDRLLCGINGDFSGRSAVAYAWFVWQKGWRGNPQIEWFN